MNTIVRSSQILVRAPLQSAFDHNQLIRSTEYNQTNRRYETLYPVDYEVL